MQSRPATRLWEELEEFVISTFASLEGEVAEEDHFGETEHHFEVDPLLDAEEDHRMEAFLVQNVRLVTKSQSINSIISAMKPRQFDQSSKTVGTNRGRFVRKFRFVVARAECRDKRPAPTWLQLMQPLSAASPCSNKS